MYSSWSVFFILMCFFGGDFLIFFWIFLVFFLTSYKFWQVFFGILGDASLAAVAAHDQECHRYHSLSVFFHEVQWFHQLGNQQAKGVSWLQESVVWMFSSKVAAVSTYPSTVEWLCTRYHVESLFRSVQLHVSCFLPSYYYEQIIKRSKWSYVSCRWHKTSF